MHFPASLVVDHDPLHHAVDGPAFARVVWPEPELHRSERPQDLTHHHVGHHAEVVIDRIALREELHNRGADIADLIRGPVADRQRAAALPFGLEFPEQVHLVAAHPGAGQAGQPGTGCGGLRVPRAGAATPDARLFRKNSGRCPSPVDYTF